MANSIPDKLKYIISVHGTTIVDNTLKCEALLLDEMPGNNKEINILVLAVKAGAVRKMSHQEQGSAQILPHLISDLQTNYGLKTDVARWSIESWAIAIGLIDRYSPVTPNELPIRVNAVVSDTTITSHDWRPIGNGEHPAWLEYHRFRIIVQKGISIDDGIFEYRMRSENGGYDIRLNTCFSQGYYNKSVSLPTDTTVIVRFGSEIKNRFWHPIDNNHLYQWFKRNAVLLKLDQGGEWVGAIFIYRRNFIHNWYELRVIDTKPFPQVYRSPQV